ncbi:hypothetical protein T06_7877 [Trichinella sp. T6]|nr:hypothetical protein T06_7877 [Trichinella sp. T6]
MPKLETLRYSVLLSNYNMKAQTNVNGKLKCAAKQHSH